MSLHSLGYSDTSVTNESFLALRCVAIYSEYTIQCGALGMVCDGSIKTASSYKDFNSNISSVNVNRSL